MTVFVVKVLPHLGWLCVLLVFCIQTPSCQGLEKLCGNSLTEALDLICSKNFARKTRRTIDPIEYYTEFQELNYPTIEEQPLRSEKSPMDDMFSLENMPFFSKNSHSSLAKTRPRRYYGVANECCKKACTMAELRSYCL